MTLLESKADSCGWSTCSLSGQMTLMVSLMTRVMGQLTLLVVQLTLMVSQMTHVMGQLTLLQSQFLPTMHHSGHAQ